jgi:hypothetical protein
MPFSSLLADVEQGVDSAPSPAERPTPQMSRRSLGQSVEALIAFLQFVGKAPSGCL